MVGCGLVRDMKKMLPELRHMVQPFHRDRTKNTTSFDGERVRFSCLPGLQGNPVATCTNKLWTLVDACVPFTTSLGCKCQRTWKHCDGWFFNDCKVRYGCGGVDASNTAWCLVEPGSCPTSARFSLGWEPFQDYCVDANYHITWAPTTIPGVDKYALLASIQYVVVVCIGFFLSFVCFRRLTSHCSRQMPDLQAVRMMWYSLGRIPAIARKHTHNCSYLLQVRWDSLMPNSREPESSPGIGQLEPLLGLSQ